MHINSVTPQTFREDNIPNKKMNHILLIHFLIGKRSQMTRDYNVSLSHGT